MTDTASTIKKSTPREIGTYNDLVHAVLERVKKLADQSLTELRIAIASADCHTLHAILKENKHLTRGELIEQIVEEEFVLEFDRDIEV